MLARKLHDLLEAECVDELCQLITEDSLPKLVVTDAGCVSNVLTYILTYDISMLPLFEQISPELMRRDLLKLALHYPEGDISHRYFNRIKKEQLTVANVDSLLSRMDLLMLLDGYFVKGSKFTVEDSSVLRIYSPPPLISPLTTKTPPTGYNIILDGENIFYSRLMTIQDVIYIVLQEGYTPLLVIRHKQPDIPGVITWKVDDDDECILQAFYEANGQVSIVTNDKYTDHIDKYNLTPHLSDRLATYDQHVIHLPPPWSRCIQKIDNRVFMP